MKTKIIFITALSLCIFLCWGCFGPPAAEEAKTGTSKAPETLPDADITIPYGLIGNELSQIQADVPSEDNGDGLVTYSLSGMMLADILHQINSELTDSIQAILENDEVYPNITGITYSDDCTLFTISLKDGQMNTYEAMLVMSFYTVGDKYQIYNGTPYEEAVTTVTYVNESDNAVVSQSDSKSMDTFSKK